MILTLLKKASERRKWLMRIGPQELLIVLVIVIIIFGPTQIPKLTKMFGKSVKGFRDGMSEDEEPKSDGDADK